MVELRGMEFTITELAEFLCKFDLGHLDNTVGALIHFASFSEDTRKVINYLKPMRVHIHYEGGYKEGKLSIEDILNSFNERELFLIRELADEVIMCSSVSDEYIDVNNYFTIIHDMADGLLSNQIKKNK